MLKIMTLPRRMILHSSESSSSSTTQLDLSISKSQLNQSDISQKFNHECIDAEFLKTDDKSDLQFFQSLTSLIESLSPIERLRIRGETQNIVLSKLRSNPHHSNI